MHDESLFIFYVNGGRVMVIPAKVKKNKEGKFDGATPDWYIETLREMRGFMLNLTAIHIYCYKNFVESFMGDREEVLATDEEVKVFEEKMNKLTDLKSLGK